MRFVRSVLFVLTAVGGVVLAIRAAILNAHGHPQFGTSLALGLVFGVLNLLGFWPVLRPPRYPKITVTAPDATPDEVYGHDEHGFDYLRDANGHLYRFTGETFVRLPPPPPPPRPWNWTGRVLLVLFWPVRAALAGYAAFFLAQELDRGFNRTLLLLALAAQVGYVLYLTSYYLAGFRVDWSRYRGRRGLRTLARVAVSAVLAGYTFVVADWTGKIITAVPRYSYRGLDHLWHLPWLNIPIVVVICLIALVVLSVIVRQLQKLISRLLGRKSALAQALDDLPIITWEGDPSLLWRRPKW